jgi:hypothetical protein
MDRHVDFAAEKNMMVSATCYSHKEINKPGDPQMAKSNSSYTN